MQEQSRRGQGPRLSDLVDRMQAFLLACVPGEVADHLSNAQKEGLLALRSYLDRCIERVDERVDRAKEYRGREGGS